MSDDAPRQPEYALQVRNNRWRLVVDLPSMAEAAAVVARVAKGSNDVKVAVEVYDPIKDAYDRKDYLTFSKRRITARDALKRTGQGFCQFPSALKAAVILVLIPVAALTVLGGRSLLMVGASSGTTPPRTEEFIIPPPSRALPREWTAAPERGEIPAVFQGEWSADCTAARLNGTGTMTVTARELFGQPVNWARTIGGRVLVNTGREGASVSTQIRSDGLVLYLEERFTEALQSRNERVTFTPERPLILSKCL